MAGSGRGGETQEVDAEGFISLIIDDVTRCEHSNGCISCVGTGSFHSAEGTDPQLLEQVVLALQSPQCKLPQRLQELVLEVVQLVSYQRQLVAYPIRCQCLRSKELAPRPCPVPPRDMPGSGRGGEIQEVDVEGFISLLMNAMMRCESSHRCPACLGTGSFHSPECTLPQRLEELVLAPQSFHRPECTLFQRLQDRVLEERKLVVAGRRKRLVDTCRRWRACKMALETSTPTDGCYPTLFERRPTGASQEWSFFTVEMLWNLTHILVSAEVHHHQLAGAPPRDA